MSCFWKLKETLISGLLDLDKVKYDDMSNGPIPRKTKVKNESELALVN